MQFMTLPIHPNHVRKAIRARRTKSVGKKKPGAIDDGKQKLHLVQKA